MNVVSTTSSCSLMSPPASTSSFKHSVCSRNQGWVTFQNIFDDFSSCDSKFFSSTQHVFAWQLTLMFVAMIFTTSVHISSGSYQLLHTGVFSLWPQKQEMRRCDGLFCHLLCLAEKRIRYTFLSFSLQRWWKKSSQDKGCHVALLCKYHKCNTGRERLIRSHSSARFSWRVSRRVRVTSTSYELARIRYNWWELGTKTANFVLILFLF